tara:strand:- start:790 stop:930 length:141 start_codon:yes stop_codon:yes gene_type:complete
MSVPNLSIICTILQNLAAEFKENGITAANFQPQSFESISYFDFFEN